VDAGEDRSQKPEWKTKLLNHRGHRGAQRKNLFSHRFSLVDRLLTDLRETRS
jgi:hypothetical protein